jgi:hypothetical protein
MLGCLFRFVDKYMCAKPQLAQVYSKPVYKPMEKSYYNLRSRKIMLN